MSLQPIAEVKLPAHDRPGGFDHAAVHQGQGRLYVAHTANNAGDVVDCSSHSYRGSITGLEAGARALVSEGQGLRFTADSREKTRRIFPRDRGAPVANGR